MALREAPIAGMPRIEDGYSVTLAPGEQVRMVGEFSCANENSMNCWLQNTGIAAWPKPMNSHFNLDFREWISPRNITDRSITYLICGSFKKTPPNGRERWYMSEHKVIEEIPGMHVIGFDDSGGDRDFNDARLTIIWM